MKIMQ